MVTEKKCNNLVMMLKTILETVNIEILCKYLECTKYL